MNNLLEQIWKTHIDDVRRVLLALTRDIDLTEDCLQDTYLRARSGFGDYRGGSAKSWLIAIAKNVFYSHVRRKSYGSEMRLDNVVEQAEDSNRVGTDDYLALLTVRDAMSELEPKLRSALIMKHYGGCDYEEIGEYLSCTPTTAKHRVWRAMQKLRSMLGVEDESEVCCSELRGGRVLDWLYGVLSPREAEKINAHITLCPACKKNLSEIRRLGNVLDKAEADYRILTLIDLDERGDTTRYVWVKQINDKHDLMTVWRWSRRPGWRVEYLALQGEPVEPHWPDDQYDPRFIPMEGKIPSPVPRGEMVDAMFIACPPAGSDWNAQQGTDKIWHYHHKHTPFPNRQGLFVVTIRLPQGAKLLKADPEPLKISTRTGRISLNWRVITEPIQVTPGVDTVWQFEANINYKLAL